MIKSYFRDFVCKIQLELWQKRIHFSHLLKRERNTTSLLSNFKNRRRKKNFIQQYSSCSSLSGTFVQGPPAWIFGYWWPQTNVTSITSSPIRSSRKVHFFDQFIRRAIDMTYMSNIELWTGLADYDHILLTS